MHPLRPHLFLVAAVGGLAGPALAGTTSGSINATATVTPTCVLSTSPVGFGNIDPLSASNVDASGGITVTCSSGTAWTAAAGVGSGTGASFASRLMTSGSNTLAYSLYTNSGRTTIWGDGTGSTATLGNTGSGSAQTVTIYGRIPSGQSAAPPGSYSDTVAVTVSY